MGAYSAWESTATLRLLGDTKRFGAHGERRGAGHIVAVAHLQLIIIIIIIITLLVLVNLFLLWFSYQYSPTDFLERFSCRNVHQVQIIATKTGLNLCSSSSCSVNDIYLFETITSTVIYPDPQAVITPSFHATPPNI